MLADILNQNKVYLIDGSGYIFRAYYAIPPTLTTKNGFPTNALYGFTKMLLSLLDQTQAKNIAVIFDSGSESFRKDIFAEYKANRKECPEDLSPQMPYFREICSSLGIPQLEKERFEADDIIGTLNKRLSQGKDVVIVSGDKDLFQLITEKTLVWDTMKNKIFDANEVLKKFQVPPGKIRDYLALVGDSSDNIPGAKGIGSKTASYLISKYGDITSIFNNIEKIREDKNLRNRNKIAKSLKENKEVILLSLELVTINTNVPLSLTINGSFTSLDNLSNKEILQALEYKGINKPIATKIFGELEFFSLLDEFGLNLAKDVRKKTDGNQLILKKNINSFLKELKKQPAFTFDIETNSLDIIDAQPCGLSFAWDKNNAFYMPLQVSSTDTLKDDLVNINEIQNELQEIFLNPTATKIAHNLKFDWQMLNILNLDIAPNYFDTMVAAYLNDPERQTLSLKSLARDYLGQRMLTYKEALGENNNFSQLDINSATTYACADARATLELYFLLKEDLKKNGVEKVFFEIEMPLIPVLKDMELTGIKIDVDLLYSLSKETEKQLIQLEDKIFKLAKDKFNLNSPKQLSEILFERLGIATTGIKKTKIGYSTNIDTLQKLKGQHPIIDLILQYRMLAKLKNTYLDVFPKLIHHKTKRLHSKFNQTIAATGRLSSSDPNLQNIPIATEYSAQIRRAFIAEQGNLIISADYSQIELRLLAHLSQDTNLIKAFLNDKDIHSETAKEILNIEEVTPLQRRIGKTINFGIIYGMSPFRLAKDLNLSHQEATNYINKYFQKFCGVKQYFDNLQNQAKNQGFVSTLFGRKRFLANINTTGRDGGFAMRALLNAPLQGSAADIIKKAMIEIYNNNWLKKYNYKIISQVHDELLIEGPAEQIKQAKNIVKEIMENIASLDVPLKVDIGSGENWLTAH